MHIVHWKIPVWSVATDFAVAFTVSEIHFCMIRWPEITKTTTNTKIFCIYFKFYFNGIQFNIQVKALALRPSTFTWVPVLVQKKKPVISNTSHFFCFNNNNTVSYTYKEFELYDDDCRKTKHSELCFKTLLIDLDTNIYKMTKHFTKLFTILAGTRHKQNCIRKFPEHKKIIKIG